MRNRISIVKENRIWNLRCQGYCYDSIGNIVNCNPQYMTAILRRVRRRPPYEEDPIRRGRYRNFLSDNQVADIRRRKEDGETLLSISRDYDISPGAIWAIAVGRTYQEPANDCNYTYNFSNRLMR